MNAADVFPLRYPGIHGESWVSGSELARLIDLTPATGRFLEVGSASGATAAIVADARPNVSLVCIDAHFDADEDRITSRDGDRSQNWRRNRRPNMSLWLGTFADFLAILPGVRFDAAFVDAGHTHNQTLEALLASAALLAPRGVIVAHDYENPAWPEVALACHQFAEDGWILAEEVGFLCSLRRT